MLKDILLYFARFPRWEGLRAIATNGASEVPGYERLLHEIEHVENKELLPAIGHYVYGQSFDQLRALLDRLSGTFLMVDFGEINVRDDSRRSLLITQRVAVTVAMKLPDSTDNLEQFLASEHTLGLLRRLYAQLRRDAEEDLLSFLTRDYLSEAEYIPFVASELNATGWTLMLNCTAPQS